ncbi:hypothetical protein BEH94_11735 [Candidatus Altiarchaeales archaeon WOR_SM1_SCG]|nr:hypothetical protein BEH94_11735 [Candidatus Altiarchaeales archaeon WOR_SM1_SCG]
MKIYCFKVCLKYRKGIWRVIEIKDSQTLKDLDNAVQGVFEHEYGHLSEFTIKGLTYCPSKAMGMTDFDHSTDVEIKSLNLDVGCQMKYVYDFGDYIEHIVELIDTKEEGDNKKYPRVAEKNKTRYRYCQKCKPKKKVVATWRCYECKQNLCDDCCEKDDDHSHMIGEIIY